MARRKDSPQKAAMRENDIAPEIMQVDTKTYYFLYQVDYRRMSSFILKK